MVTTAGPSCTNSVQNDKQPPVYSGQNTGPLGDHCLAMGTASWAKRPISAESTMVDIFIEQPQLS